jgi:hypothetical protein
MVNDEQILAFVRDHPLAFRLDKVEQTWFMDLITSGGLIRKAIADEHAPSRRSLRSKENHVPSTEYQKSKKAA